MAKCCFLFLIRSIGFDTSIQRGIFFPKISHVYFLWIYSFKCNPLINKCYSSVFARKNSEKVRKRQPNIFDIFSIHSNKTSVEDKVISVKKRNFVVKNLSNRIAHFQFNEICGDDRGTEDYLEFN